MQTQNMKLRIILVNHFLFLVKIDIGLIARNVFCYFILILFYV